MKDNPRLNFLFARRPAIDYVSPAVCDVVFSSTGFPMIIFPDFRRVQITGMVWEKWEGYWRLRWDTNPDVICWTIYLADDPDNPFGSYHVVAECLDDPEWIPPILPRTTFKIVAITATGEEEVLPPGAGIGPGPGFDQDPYKNAALDVEEECPLGGGTFYYTVPADLFEGWTQFEADTKAFAAAHDMALLHMICLDDVLPDACGGKEYSGVITASGGQPDSFLSVAGSFPPGLSLFTDPLIAEEAILEGTPTTGGLSGFTIRCADASAEYNYVERQYNVAVMAITTPVTLPQGTGNVPYSATIAQTGGTAPLNFAVTLGNLPAGLNLAPSTGVISGTPTAGGPSAFSVTVTDDTGLACTKEFDLFVVATLIVDFHGGASICLGGGFTTTLVGVSSANGGAPNCYITYMNPDQRGLLLTVGQNYDATVRITSGSGCNTTSTGLEFYNFNAGVFKCFINGIQTPLHFINYDPRKCVGYTETFTVRFEFV